MNVPVRISGDQENFILPVIYFKLFLANSMTKQSYLGKDAVATLCVWVFVLYMHMPHFVCACVWRCKFNKVQSLLCATGTHSFKRLPQNETNLFSPLFSPSNCSIFSMYKVKTFSSQHPCAMSSTFRRCQSTLNVTECMYSIRSRPLKAEANGQASALQPLQ